MKSATGNRAFVSISKGDAANFLQLQLALSGALYVQMFSDGGSWTITSAATIYDDNEWHHIVVTQDGVNARMYVDGVLEAASGGSAWLADITTPAFFRVGGLRYNSTDLPFAGSLDGLKYYSGRVPSQTEITNDFNSYNGGIK